MVDTSEEFLITWPNTKKDVDLIGFREFTSFGSIGDVLHEPCPLSDPLPSS